MENLDLNASIVEALLIASDIPMTQIKLNEVLDEGLKINLPECVNYLNKVYRETRRSFFISELAGGYLILTKKDYEHFIRKYINHSGRIRLSSAALETIAIVAYKQPISKPDIEQIRGVNSDGVMSTLLERNLVKVKGRADVPGRPLLYATTEDFLKYFGLNSSLDLPRLKELENMTAGEETNKNFNAKSQSREEKVTI
ncbi:MAG: SMC-Scp complex subunit ScpB [Candidatus Marinimicrobia bacterium]|nr:SMC-Scp complex subunit ScpB [Candidatus Neomarinimicrobiota bacterium]